VDSKWEIVMTALVGLVIFGFGIAAFVIGIHTHHLTWWLIPVWGTIKLFQARLWWGILDVAGMGALLILGLVSLLEGD
jgi:hypothetical protein